VTSVPSPQPVVLSSEEQALLERIDFEPDGAGPSQTVRRSGDAALQLMHSLLGRGAIPQIRLRGVYRKSCTRIGIRDCGVQRRALSASMRKVTGAT
jgi:hypothetical protein